METTRRSLDPDDFTDAQAIAEIERITRALKINQLEMITDDVIEAAASTLVMGN